jgi:soluble lytic murein transglycosylase-like protein
MLCAAGVGCALLLSACSTAGLVRPQTATPVAANSFAAHRSAATVPVAAYAPRRAGGDLDVLISAYAAQYGVPVSLVHRVVQRESGYNARARSGPYYGLMQIRHDTARSMGYSGPASGLLDPETNLKYGVKYLAGAYLVANRNSDQAVRNYAHGYYYQAKSRGMLKATGLN